MRYTPIITLFSFLITCASGYAETLTLSDCLKRAASANHDLKVAEYDTLIARENIGIGRSGYLPRVDFQGGYTAQQAPQSFIIMNFQAPTQQRDYAFYSASIEQTVYDFGRTSSRYERAKSLTNATSYGFSARKQDVFLQVVEAYYGVLESLKFLQSADEELVQMTDHLKVARNLFDQGVVTRNDLLQAEVQLANSKQRSLAAANNVKNTWLYLNYLTGQPPNSRADLVDSQERAPALTNSEAEKVMARRPEILAQKKNIDAGELSVKESRSGYFPEIFTRLAADYVENKMVKEQTILSATIGLRINLFDGLATTSRYRQSVEALSQNREALRRLEASVHLEYDTAMNDARVAAERIDTVKKSIQQGEENLRINKDRYMEQVGTATNVIDAQTLLTQTRTDYYRAVFDYQVAVARVKKALGEL
jgi:outer membrane protein TolC